MIAQGTSREELELVDILKRRQPRARWYRKRKKGEKTFIVCRRAWISGLTQLKRAIYILAGRAKHQKITSLNLLTLIVKAVCVAIPTEAHLACGACNHRAKGHRHAHVPVRGLLGAGDIGEQVKRRRVR